MPWPLKHFLIGQFPGEFEAQQQVMKLRCVTVVREGKNLLKALQDNIGQDCKEQPIIHPLDASCSTKKVPCLFKPEKSRLKS